MLERFWQTDDVDNPTLFLGLTIVATVAGIVVLVAAFPAFLWINILLGTEVASGYRPSHVQSFIWFYSGIVAIPLLGGSFASVFASESAFFRWSGRALLVVAIFLLASMSLEALKDGNRISNSASILSFVSLVFLSWYSRILFWVSFRYCPSKIELKIQDIFVAVSAGAAVVSRWADLTHLNVKEFSPIMVFLGAVAFGLLLAKYTFELIELIASKMLSRRNA